MGQMINTKRRTKSKIMTKAITKIHSNQKKQKKWSERKHKPKIKKTKIKRKRSNKNNKVPNLRKNQRRRRSILKKLKNLIQIKRTLRFNREEIVIT